MTEQLNKTMMNKLKLEIHITIRRLEKTLSLPKGLKITETT